VYSETALAPVSSVGFIGAGNIGFAMARAVASRFPGLAIHVYDPRSERSSPRIWRRFWSG
jgi:ornithine cyclodeaminase/alanine dehydrogenase-like protein (mu-crystallin family)